MSVHEVLHHGWLVKSPPEAKSRLFGNLIKKQWKKKYFVLSYISPLKKTSSNSRHSITPSLNSSFNLNTSKIKQNTASEVLRLELSYYENEDKNKLQGSIDLMRCEEVLSHLQSTCFKHVFAIRTYHKNNKPRIYYLVTATDIEMLTWVGHLTNHLRIISEKNSIRQVSQSAVSISSLYNPQQWQTSNNNSQFHSAFINHFTSPSHPSNLSYSTTIKNNQYSSNNNLEIKFLQNGLTSTLGRKNVRGSNENSPLPSRVPFLKRMESISQRSERPTSRLVDNTPHDFRSNMQPPLCPPQPNLHAFLPLLASSNNTLPLYRTQCTEDERMGTYDRPVPQKTPQCFFENIDNLMKLQNNSMDPYKLSSLNGMVYDVPSHIQYFPPLHHNHYDLPPIPYTSSPSRYDIPLSLKDSSKNVVYDTPESAKITSQTSQPPFQINPSESGVISNLADTLYSVPMKENI